MSQQDDDIHHQGSLLGSINNECQYQPSHDDDQQPHQNAKNNGIRGFPVDEEEEGEPQQQDGNAFLQLTGRSTVLSSESTARQMGPIGRLLHRLEGCLDGLREFSEEYRLPLSFVLLTVSLPKVAAKVGEWRGKEEELKRQQGTSSVATGRATSSAAALASSSAPYPEAPSWMRQRRAALPSTMQSLAASLLHSLGIPTYSELIAMQLEKELSSSSSPSSEEPQEQSGEGDAGGNDDDETEVLSPLLVVAVAALGALILTKVVTQRLGPAAPRGGRARSESGQDSIGIEGSSCDESAVLLNGEEEENEDPNVSAAALAVVPKPRVPPLRSQQTNNNNINNQNGIPSYADNEDYFDRLVPGGSRHTPRTANLRGPPVVGGGAATHLPVVRQPLDDTLSTSDSATGAPPPPHRSIPELGEQPVEGISAIGTLSTQPSPARPQAAAASSHSLYSPIKSPSSSSSKATPFAASCALVLAHRATPAELYSLVTQAVRYGVRRLIVTAERAEPTADQQLRIVEYPQHIHVVEVPEAELPLYVQELSSAEGFEIVGVLSRGPSSSGNGATSSSSSSSTVVNLRDFAHPEKAMYVLEPVIGNSQQQGNLQFKRQASSMWTLLEWCPVRVVVPVENQHSQVAAQLSVCLYDRQTKARKQQDQK